MPATLPTINPTQQQLLIRRFSDEEIKAAVWGLNSEGAPGPDEIPVFFYKECWDLVRLELLSVMEDFHAGRCQKENLNKVYLILLPKTVGAESIGDFRPISLSNSIYLIIAKVLANRLREVLDGLISLFQFAFIPGRQMIDSVVLAEEIVRHHQLHVESGLCQSLRFH